MLGIGFVKGGIRFCRRIGIFNEEQKGTALGRIDDCNQKSDTYDESLFEKLNDSLDAQLYR